MMIYFLNFKTYTSYKGPTAYNFRQYRHGVVHKYEGVTINNEQPILIIQKFRPAKEDLYPKSLSDLSDEQRSGDGYICLGPNSEFFWAAEEIVDACFEEMK